MLLVLAFVDDHTIERRYQSKDIAPDRGTYTLSSGGGTLDLGSGPVPFTLGSDLATISEEGRTFKKVSPTP